jgi:hypothetical protein
LFLDRENPISVVMDRFERLEMSDGPTLTYWGGWHEMEAPAPGSPIVVDWVKSCEPRPLVIVDSLVAFHGGNENDAGEMRAFMDQCRKLADLGATATVLHHDGKAESAKDYRGSSDFKASVDQAFHVSNYGDDRLLDKMVLRCYKSRFGLTGQLQYRYAGGKCLLDEDRAAVSRTNAEQLTALLRCNPGIHTTAFESLAEKNNVCRNRARDFLNTGVLANEIRMESGGKNKKLYFLAMEGCK